MSALKFIQEQLSAPGVDLVRAAEACDVSERTLQNLKAGVASNTSVERIERIALHLGYRLKPVRARRERDGAGSTADEQAA
jgi:hypothetical protein